MNFVSEAIIRNYLHIQSVRPLIYVILKSQRQQEK